MKNLVYLFVFLLLCAAAYWLLQYRPSTQNKESRDFSVSDTASVTKIIMADKHGDKVTLERVHSNLWRVNGKLDANQDKIRSLLETMKQVEVKSPVPQKDLNSVITDMATRNTLVKIYQNGMLSKTYFVGIQTVDQLGTYMLMEHSKAPFIMHIPGFNGFLNGRYFTSQRDWKTRRVFDWPAEEIESVSVTYPGDMSSSFTIKNKPGYFYIEPFIVKNPLINPDTQMLKYYMASFRNVMYEGYDQAFNAQKADSVSKMMPYCIMALKTKNGQKSMIRIYSKGVDQHTMQQFEEGSQKPLTIDPERYLAFLNDEKDLIVIQHYVFGNLLRKYQDFYGKAG